MYNALLVEPADDVIVVLEALPAGGQAVYRDGDATGNVTALNDIPIYHKIAIHPIKKGGHIIKYGETIGIAIQDIQTGEHVHVQNLDSEREYLP